ncbi:putative rhamnogalacturonate lyase C [Colletotrichum orbiculare MAFF 240422]|uniref:Rhamnogalacturonate lyase C n=1 Tax=Colletotrichum orbiculare (strain 104-T / ATCC 96160 / CBS 514.97 / LARS 414 / MAFF 240422) TaxID=1213857 RepID=N4VGJ2_COLOR|nr:putative rhamnogalacturonate lyase C [Colletotrichum orbiculare MAFF 240422]
MESKVKTRIFIISDTCGKLIPFNRILPEPFVAEVAIHCGNLTENSTIKEYMAGLREFDVIFAPLKLVIPGNRDLHLDPESLLKKAEEAARAEGRPFDRERVDEEVREVRRLLAKAKETDGVTVLDEGTHTFTLINGAKLKIFVSPYTPGTDGGAFRYSTSHDFNIEEGTDIVATHGPPHGIMDIGSSGEHIGCPQLFRAIARSQPKIHCFGHVHQSWGGRLVSWRPELSEKPSHTQDIDDSKTLEIENLGRESDPEDVVEARRERIKDYIREGFCPSNHTEKDERPLAAGETIFVNASAKGSETSVVLGQPQWLVEIDLPKAESEAGVFKKEPGVTTPASCKRKPEEGHPGGPKANSKRKRARR